MKIVPVLQTPPDVVQYYWQKLAMEDQLQYRLSDIPNPTWDDVLKMIRRMGTHMYMGMNDVKPLGEFALENFSGKAAQIHFSANPENTLRETLDMTRYSLMHVLSHWKNEKNESYLDTLVGLTPVNNRRACLFVLKAGMKKMGIIPSACIHSGQVCDGMLTTLTREGLLGN